MQNQSSNCHLVGPFALAIQLGSGFIALLVLALKRWFEKPQRPFKVWVYDASKQALGALTVHMINIAIAIFARVSKTPGTDTQPEEVDVQWQQRDTHSHLQLHPCSVYLLNLIFDTTVGIPILLAFLAIISWLATLTAFGKPIESIKSGHYDNPPQLRWWLKQSTIYLSAVVSLKLTGIFLFALFPIVYTLGDWVLDWTNGDEKLKVAFVFIIAPIAMNSIQYCITDAFIKRQEPNNLASIVGNHRENSTELDSRVLLRNIDADD